MSIDERMRRRSVCFRKFNDLVKSDTRDFPAELIEEMERLEYTPPENVMRLALSPKYRGSDSLQDIEEERARVKLSSDILNLCKWRGQYYHQHYDENGMGIYTIAARAEELYDNVRHASDDAPDHDGDQADVNADVERNEGEEEENDRQVGDGQEGDGENETDEYIESLFEPSQELVVYEEPSVRQDWKVEM